MCLVLALRARQGPNTQDQAGRLKAAAGHLFEDVTASYHPPGVAGQRLQLSRASRSNIAVTSSIGSMMSDLLSIAGISVFSLVCVMDTSPLPGTDDFNEYVYPYAQLSWRGSPAMAPTPFRQQCNKDVRRFDARSIGHLKILQSFSKDNPLTQWVYLRMSRGVVQDMPIHSLNVQEWLSKGTGARVHRCSGARPHRY